MKGCWIVSSLLVVLIAYILPRIYKIHVSFFPIVASLTDLDDAGRTEPFLPYGEEARRQRSVSSKALLRIQSSDGVYDAIQRLDLKENSTLLELCIGPGEALFYKGVKVIGVDISPVRNMAHKSGAVT
eukprot:751230-Hanusia_phi.AAC.1